MKTPKDMTPGTIYKMQDGEIVIVSYNKWDDVVVKFIGYDHLIRVESSHIRRRVLKNILMPRLFGIGFVGYGHFTTTKENLICYRTWQDMLKRCYSKDYQSKFPSYKGCTVCDEWHNFQNFAAWYYENHPKDGEKYQLDKDIKIKGNKEYSPSACKFVTRQENASEASAKHYTMKNPSGDKIEIHNMRQFCLKNSLHPAHMIAVSKGKLKQHKGWTKAD